MLHLQFTRLSVGLGILSFALWAYPFLTATLRPTIIDVLPTVNALQGTTVETAVIEDRVEVPELGISTPLIHLPNIDPMSIRDWGAIGPALRKGVALTTNGKNFESSASSFLIGHSSDYVPNKYSFVFAGLNSLEIGDTIDVSIDGKTYQHRVIEKKVLSPDDNVAFAALQKGVPNTHQLSLVTCWPVFTTKQRLVVVAERVAPN